MAILHLDSFYLGHLGIAQGATSFVLMHVFMIGDIILAFISKVYLGRSCDLRAVALAPSQELSWAMEFLLREFLPDFRRSGDSGITLLHYFIIILWCLKS